MRFYCHFQFLFILNPLGQIPLVWPPLLSNHSVVYPPPQGGAFQNDALNTLVPSPCQAIYLLSILLILVRHTFPEAFFDLFGLFRQCLCSTTWSRAGFWAFFLKERWMCSECKKISRRIFLFSQKCPNGSKVSLIWSNISFLGKWNWVDEPFPFKKPWQVRI